MLEQLERFVLEHAASWRLDLRPRTRLRALLRANPGNDGIVREVDAGQIGTVIFWFRAGDPKPFLVSKIVGPALTDVAIAECKTLQESANRVLGYPLFPKIHAVAEFGGAQVVFMEPVGGPSYEILMARAVWGPERSVKALQRVVSQYLHELGAAARALQSIHVSGGETTWGSAAAANARHFLQLCPGAAAIVQERHVSQMSRLIDTIPLKTHLVLAEDFSSNYLPGPRAVDQLVPDIRGLCAQWPGPVSGLRILIAFFRALPVQHAYSGYTWLDALASSIVDENRMEVVGAPVRRFLGDIGLGTTSPVVSWAFVMGAFFLRGSHELGFYAQNAMADRLRGEFSQFAADLIRITDSFESAAGAAPRLATPRLNRDYLDGEFFNRNDPDFSSFPRLATPMPRWIAAAVRFQYAFKERHPWFYRCVRWIYGLPMGLLERAGWMPRD